MRTPKTILIFSAILSMISIAGILYWFGWKLLLCMFFFEWGRNAYKNYMKQKEEIQNEKFSKELMNIIKK